MARCSYMKSLDRDGCAGDMGGVFTGQPQSQVRDLGGVEPFVEVRVRHSFAVRGSIHGSGKNHIRCKSRVLIFECYGAHQGSKGRFEGHVGSETCMRLRRRKAADYEDSTTARFTEMGNGGAQNVEGGSQIQVAHLLPSGIICVFHFRASGE